MPPSTFTFDLPSNALPTVLWENGTECGLIGKLLGLRYECTPDIPSRPTLERTF